MRILISGAGIAGPALAWWLLHYGHTPTIVETAPRLRTGGYVIDFWGAGFEIAERMGLLPAIRSQGYDIQEVRVVGRDGRRVAGFPAAAFSRMTQGRYVSLARGDLSAILFDAIRERAEVIFDDRIASLEQTPEAVEVTLEHGGCRSFDAVIGADGLHSGVRQIVFGPEARFERYLGYKAAAFEVPGYRPRDELVYVMFTEVGQQVARFSMHGDQTMFLFTFRDSDPNLPATVEEQRAILRKRFGRSGWECPRILEALDGCSSLYFDRVSQIHMDSWSSGRVTLAGDAASCVSLLAGQGSALAMIAAYILAGELHRAAGDCAQVFSGYRQRFGPFVEKKQKAAPRFADMFAPRSPLALTIRNQVMNLMSIGWIASLAMGSDLSDRIELPDY